MMESTERTLSASSSSSCLFEFGKIRLVLVILLSLCGQSCSGPLQQQTSYSNPEDLRGSWMYMAILSAGVMITLIGVLFMCGAGGGCCGLGEIHWFGRTRASLERPMSFENPVALEGGTMMTPLSQIDVRALELDPVVFEPLPSIQDLSPLTVNPYNFGGGAKARPPGGFPPGGPSHSPTHYSNTTGLPSSIPFSNKETNVFAHDWFEEPYDNFPRSNLEYVREVGKGWFGQVMEADAKDIVPYARNLRVLVKILRSDASQLDQMKFLDESRWYRDSVECGNILKLLGHSVEKLPFLLIMEQCPQGDLKSFLIANVIRAEMLSSQGTLLRMALDVAKGLEWMSSADFVHHDLAARNCQVASEGRVVLGDYGLSTQQYRDDYYWNSNVPIPLRWTAPETLHITSSTIQTLEVSKLSNIWTYAVVLWEIMEFGKLPYFELNDEEVISRVIADKNYVLGQPTLPYIPLKEQLYSIMASCWSMDPAKRPTMPSIVIKLKKLLNTLTNEEVDTPNSVRIKSVVTSTPQEQFDTRWDQIGRSATTSSISGIGFANNGNSDERRKKSVSFTGLIDETKETTPPSGNKEALLQKQDTTSILPQADTESTVAEDDDSSWSRISQKVQEKSQSVQNLMVLTHVDTSELGDPDSLLFVLAEKTSSQPDMSSEVNNDSSQATSDSAPPANNPPPPNTPSNPSDCDAKAFASDENNLPHHEKSKEITSVTSSQHHQSKNSSSASPDKIMSNNTPQKFTLSSSSEMSPRKTGIDINVIQPSPPVTNNADEKARRNISTPISSPAFNPDVASPSGEIVDDIFETEINTIGPISPSKCDITRIPPGNLVTTVLMGANDDYGLSEYQGVSTNLIDTSLARALNNQVGSHDDIEGLTSLSKEMEVEGGLAIASSFGSPIPNNLFVMKAKNLSNGSDLRQHPLDSKLQVLGQVSNGGPHILTSKPTNGVGDTENHDEKSDGDEFWSNQIEQIRNSTKSTKELFELSLADDCDYKTDRFVEDIEAAQEELGSLVLTDLEDDNNSVHTIVPESSRDISKPDEFGAKMAFVSTADDSLDLNASAVACSQDTVEGNVNSSVDIEKENLSVDTSMLDVSWAEPTSKGATEEVSSFVPSKWNQSLTPIKPAIKSPAVGPFERDDDQSNKNGGGMKKSVSFERNKTQLVYKYPPPDPGSDSDGDESHFSLNARLRLSSGTNSSTSTRTAIPMFPSAASLDWDLTQEELEANEMNNDESDEEDLPKTETVDPMNMYRISGFSDLNDETSFHVRGSDEPFSFPPPIVPSTLGELRHTKDRLRLDLNSKGEASLLDEDGSGDSKDRSARHRLSEVQTPPPKLDSGVGSSAATSTSVSPFFAATSTNDPSTLYENKTLMDENQPNRDSDVKDGSNLTDC